MNASSFFSKEQQSHILSAVREAEKETSGEIRVHIETKLTGDVLDRAAWIFRKIGMLNTEQRNGVLFYLAVETKKFAVIGDSGLNIKVPSGFWDEIKGTMKEYFSGGHFTEGLINGIIMAGRQLKEHFPYQANDINELPDSISFDDTI